MAVVFTSLPLKVTPRHKAPQSFTSVVLYARIWLVSDPLAILDQLKRVDMTRKPRKAKADAAPLYGGGKALGVVKTGPERKEASLNLSEFQKAAERKGVSVCDEVLDYWSRNKHELRAGDAIKLLGLMLEHTSPKVKPIEGQIQVDGNVSVTMVYLNQPVEEKVVQGVVEVVGEKV